MNNAPKTLSFLLAAGTAGVALAEFAGFFSSLPVRGEATLLAAVSAGLLLLLVRDYARRPAAFQPRARVVRPPLARRETRRLEAIVERAA